MSKYINAAEYIRKADAVDAVAFGITTAKAINIETGESRDLFANENEELQRAIRRIKALPSADVRENTHGEWIRQEYCCVCSNCHKYYISIGDKYDFNFCPNCGARMSERKETI